MEVRAHDRAARLERWVRVALTLLVLGTATRAHADATNVDELDRWTLSMSIDVGLQLIDGKAAGSSGPLFGPPLPDDPLIQDPLLNGPPTVSDPSSGSQLLTTPFAGFEFELMTPRISSGFGDPRLFLEAGISTFWGTENDIAKAGVPGEFAIPTDLPSGRPLAEVVVQGQGSATSAEVQPLGVNLEMGLAFSRTLSNRRLRIKPSFAYRRIELEVSAITRRAVQQQRAPFPTQLSDFRLITLSEKFIEVYHGVGPSLEIEVDSSRVGPFVLSLYLEGTAIAILGDRVTPMSAVNEFGEVARWNYKVDQWSFGVGTGLRFRWVPE